MPFHDDLFSRNSAYAKFRENKPLANIFEFTVHGPFYRLSLPCTNKIISCIYISLNTIMKMSVEKQRTCTHIHVFAYMTRSGN